MLVGETSLCIKTLSFPRWVGLGFEVERRKEKLDGSYGVFFVIPPPFVITCECLNLAPMVWPSAHPQIHDLKLVHTAAAAASFL